MSSYYLRLLTYIHILYIRYTTDILPNAGSNFINKVKLLSSAGIPQWLVRVILRQSSPSTTTNSHNHHKSSTNQQKSSTNQHHNDVFNLDYLLYQVMKGTQRLDWHTFEHNERIQPLHIISTSTLTLQTIKLNRNDGNYVDLLSLLACIRASMTVPGMYIITLIYTRHSYTTYIYAFTLLIYTV